jgi:hypothetical protein
MESALENRIRERAYFLWLSGGEAGDEKHFWLIAEREELADVAMNSAAAFQSAKARGKRSPRSGAHATGRVNALVQLDSSSNCEQATFGRAAG